MQLCRHSSCKPESNRKPRVEKLTVSDRVCKRFSIQRCFTVCLLHLTKKKTNTQNAETHCNKMMTAQALNTVRYRNLPGNKPSTWILNVQKTQTNLRKWQTLSFIQVTSTKCAKRGVSQGLRLTLMFFLMYSALLIRLWICLETHNSKRIVTVATESTLTAADDQDESVYDISIPHCTLYTRVYEWWALHNQMKGSKCFLKDKACKLS